MTFSISARSAIRKPFGSTGFGLACCILSTCLACAPASFSLAGGTAAAWAWAALDRAGGCCFSRAAPLFTRPVTR